MNRPRIALPIALLAALVLGTTAHAALRKGSSAPSFALSSTTGARVTDGTLKESGLSVLTFVSVDSKPSRELVITLASLVKRYGEDRIRVVAISADSSKSLGEFTTRHKLPYPILHDSDGATMKAYGAESIVPMTYLLGPDGTVVETVSGGGMATQHVLGKLAEKEFARGNADAAEDLYRQVVEKDPADASARAGLVTTLTKQGKIERATQEIAKLESMGQPGLAAGGRANIALANGDFDEVARIASRAPTDDASVQIAAAQAELAKGNLSQAQGILEVVVNAPTTNPLDRSNGLRNLANVAKAQDKVGKSIELHQKAIEAEPLNTEARSDLAVTLAKAGRTAEAKKTLAVAQKIAPNDQLVASLLRRIERREKELVDLKRQELVSKMVGELAEAFRSGNVAKASPDDWSPRKLVVSFVDVKDLLGPLSRDGLSDAFLFSLAEQLQSSNRVDVVDREMLDKLLTELKLGSSDLADPATRLKLGRVFAASVIGTGGFYNLGGGGELRLRLIDTETTEIRETIQETVRNPAAVGDAAAAVATRIQAMLRKAYPLRGKIAEVDGGEILIGIGQKHGATTGQRFEVLAQGKPVKIDGEIVGYRNRKLGKLEVTSVEDAFSYAKPVEGGSFASGQRIVEIGL